MLKLLGNIERYGGRVVSVVGRRGEKVVLRCGARGEVEWRMEREGVVEETILKNTNATTRKLSVSVGPLSVGVYICYRGGQVVSSFNLTMVEDSGVVVNNSFKEVEVTEHQQSINSSGQ